MGASENVAMAELGTHLATEKMRVITLHLEQPRPSSIPIIRRVVTAIAGSVNYASRLCFLESGLVVGFPSLANAASPGHPGLPRLNGPSGTRVIPVRAGVASLRIYCS